MKVRGLIKSIPKTSTVKLASNAAISIIIIITEALIIAYFLPTSRVEPCSIRRLDSFWDMNIPFVVSISCTS